VIHVVLVNHKGHNDTIECLESLLKSEEQDFTVWVIDNSPTLESWHALQAWSKNNVGQNTEPGRQIASSFKEEELPTVSEENLPKICFVRAMTNAGFAAANNVAIRRILQIEQEGWVWILNNDTVVESKTLGTLLAFAMQRQQSAIIGCKLMDYANPTLIQTVGCRYYKWFGVIHELAKMQPDDSRWDKPFRFDYVVGASMFVSIPFIRESGTMEEQYFIYYEELDWCTRARRSSWTIDFCPGAKVYHKGGATIKEGSGNSRRMDFYSIRNRILIALKFFPYTLPTLYAAFALFLIRRAMRGQFDRITMLIQIVFSPWKKYSG
jgi:GT2 family glycosyltransferase